MTLSIAKIVHCHW